MISEQDITCEACEGDGRDFADQLLVCPACSGSGKNIEKVLAWLAALKTWCCEDHYVTDTSRKPVDDFCDEHKYEVHVPKYPTLRESEGHTWCGRGDNGQYECVGPGKCAGLGYTIVDPERAAMRLGALKNLSFTICWYEDAYLVQCGDRAHDGGTTSGTSLVLHDAFILAVLAMEQANDL